jgi:hypothetical protein
VVLNLYATTIHQIKAARFQAYKDLAGFNFAASEVNEALATG